MGRGRVEVFKIIFPDRHKGFVDLFSSLSTPGSPQTSRAAMPATMSSSKDGRVRIYGTWTSNVVVLTSVAFTRDRIWPTSSRKTSFGVTYDR